MPHRPLVVLDGIQRGVDDAEAVGEDVEKYERQHADREHRERHACPAREQRQPADREPQVDGEAGQSSENDRMRQRHVLTNRRP